MDGLTLAPPDGAFYVFPRVDAFYREGLSDSASFCRRLLDEARVAAIPGGEFGEDRCIRFSIATSDELLAEGLHRFGGWLDTLRAAGAPTSARER
jgi:aspartate aminotransferase